jgi:hypothetical protein
MASKIEGQAKVNPGGNGECKLETSQGNVRGNRRNCFYQNEWKKDVLEIPILKYGPMNNFMEFKEALSKRALLEYGDLGKLIKHGKVILPEMPDQEK